MVVSCGEWVPMFSKILATDKNGETVRLFKKYILVVVRLWMRSVWPLKWKLLKSTFMRYCLYMMLYKVVLTFTSVDETLVFDHSNESYWAVLSCGNVYYAIQGGSIFYVCGWNPCVWPFMWKLLNSLFLLFLFLNRFASLNLKKKWLSFSSLLKIIINENESVRIPLCTK